MVVTILGYFYTIVTITFLVVAFHFSKKKTQLKEKLTLWFLFGFLYNLFSLSVLYTLLPLNWISPAIDFAGLMTAHFFVSLLSGVSYLLVGIIDYKTKTLKFRPFIFSFAFVAAEIIRSMLVLFILWGNDTSFGLHFTFWTIGSALANTPLVELAYPFGIFSLTFFTVLIVSSLMYERKCRYIFLNYFFVAVIFSYLHFLKQDNEIRHPLTVASISTNYDYVYLKENATENFLQKRKEKLKELVTGIEKYNPEIIIFPEDSRFISLSNEKEVNELVDKFPNTYIFDSGVLEKANGFLNASTVHFLKDGITLGRGKWFLAPFGEYVPKLFRPILLFANKDNFLLYEKNHTYIKGKEAAVFNLPKANIGTLLCSEMLSFSSVYNLGRQKPELVFLQTDMNLFHGNKWFTSYYIMNLKLNSATMRAYTITSTNSVPIAVVNKRGRLVYIEKQDFGSHVYTVDTKGILKIK